MWMLMILLLVLGCKNNKTAAIQTDSMNLTGATGRNLTIQVFGLDKKRSKTNVHRVCAIGLAGNEAFKREAVIDKLACSREVKPDGTLSVELKNLPYPAYITLFHDENLNSVLDFATFNVVLAKKQGPMEGTGTLKDADPQTKYSRPIWVEVGNNQTEGYIKYTLTPIWQFISEEAWQYFYNWYLEKAYFVNHPNGKKNPFCTRAEDCL
ncbi:MAG: DUF2141 domain-containing protein [Betaproteobacteria bacterium]|nr:DUF2141 domain-containing protein [Betaproteobacteria bacterium]